MAGINTTSTLDAVVIVVLVVRFNPHRACWRTSPAGTALALVELQLQEANPVEK